MFYYTEYFGVVKTINIYMTGIARIGDIIEGKCKNHSDTTGTIITGSTDVMINSTGVATVNSVGQLDCNNAHQTISITGGGTVLVNGLQIHRIGDISAGDPNDSDLFTCITGSTDVIADDNFSDNGGNNINPDLSAYSLSSTSAVRMEAGRYAVFDEIESISETPESYGPDIAAPPERIPVSEPVSTVITTTPNQGVCIMSDTINYNLQLSPNFKLGDLTVNALFKHKLQAQAGFSVKELTCNMQSLCNEVLEKLRSNYPNFRINSGFRTVTIGKSQHERGMAVDLQWPGKAPSEYLTIAKWMVQNLVFDQLIFEHGNSIWIHVSFNRLAAVQRKQVLTMFKGAYTPGLTLRY